MSSLQGVGGVTPPRHNLSRRPSSNVLNSPSTNMFPKSPLAQQLPEPTPESVAKEHFEKEMEIHKSVSAKTVVIVHDYCYGHRYSRPRTSKASLGTIVERPERILASVLGLAAAYVRLGGRHQGGRYAPHPDLDPVLLHNPPFQIRKTSRTMPLSSPAVIHVHGNKWMEELKIMCDSAEAKLALNGKELVRPTGPGKEEDGTKRKFHEGDLYLCSESLNAFEGALGGICDGIDAIFGPSNTRRAFVAIRPPGHHCAADYPSGFCWLNNVQVGIIHAAITHGLTHAAIIDFDLHHGDGSQSITWDHNRRATMLPKNAAAFKKTPIGYFSLHDINSYPCEMGDEEKIRSASLCIENAHGQSIWNVHLHSWKNAQEFWRLYETKYMVLIEKARNFLRIHTERLKETSNGGRPKAAIFLSAGFDASEWEGAGMQRHKVNVPTDFYAKFTSDVVRLAEEEGLGVDGRVISVLEGGYSDRALTSGVMSHLSGLASVDSDFYQADDAESSRLASEMRQRLGLLDQAEGQKIKLVKEEDFVSFDTEWWAPSRLEELELLVNPPPVPPAPKKPKEKVPPTYSSPTQASTAKRVSSFSGRRSLSGNSSIDVTEQTFEPNPVVIPDVDWATAAHELSKVLIPANRQTNSCKHEDLNAEATRVRRERQSNIGLPAVLPGEEGNRMQLRDRKSKAPNYAIDEERPVSRSSRRTTIAAVGDLPAPGAEQPSEGGPPDFTRSVITHRRRSSAASMTSSVGGMNVIGTSTGTGPSQRQSSLEIGKVRNGNSTTASTTMGDKSANIPVVKKRVVTGTKAKPTTGRTSPRKAPPVPRVPSLSCESAPTASTQPQPEIKTETQVEPPIQSSSTNGDANGDLDDLTSKMKKVSIKLKLPPKEEQVAKEKAVADEKKKLAARAPRKPAAPKTTKQTTSKAPPKIAPAPAPAPVAPPTHFPQSQPDNRPGAPTVQPEPPPTPPMLPTQSLPSPRSTDDIEPRPQPPQAPIIPKAEPVPIVPDAFPPTQPSLQQPSLPAAPVPTPAPAAASVSPPRHTQPKPRSQISTPRPAFPNQDHTTSTSSSFPASNRPTSPPTHRNNLPVFTSTSPIHFGLPKQKTANSPPSTRYRQPEKTYVPYRPEGGMIGLGMNDLSNVPVGEGADMMDTDMVHQPAGNDGSRGNEGNVNAHASIWDVPETPQR
jgi:histone deacetylase HOS3